MGEQVHTFGMSHFSSKLSIVVLQLLDACNVRRCGRRLKHTECNYYQQCVQWYHNMCLCTSTHAHATYIHTCAHTHKCSHPICTYVRTHTCTCTTCLCQLQLLLQLRDLVREVSSLLLLSLGLLALMVQCGLQFLTGICTHTHRRMYVHPHTCMHPHPHSSSPLTHSPSPPPHPISTLFSPLTHAHPLFTPSPPSPHP